MSQKVLTVLCARDLVSKQDMWHLVRRVTDEVTPSNTPHSISPLTKSDEECAPIDDSNLLGKAIEQTRAFRSAANLPCFMSLHETGAIRFLGAALVHNNAGAEVGATKAVSAAFKSLYGKPLEKRTKQILCAQLKKPISSEQRMLIGTYFRHTFAPNDWPAEALQNTETWKSVFRCSSEEAQAWSAYLYVMAACGAIAKDPQFVKRVAERVGGIGYGNHDAVDKLIGTVNEVSAKRTTQDIALAARSALLQASHAAELSEEENIFNI
jgi:hypothetical protein